MQDGSDPETPVSGEQRIVDCFAFGIVNWEISLGLWDYLDQLPEEDRQQVLDLMTDQLHAQCHSICERVVLFVEKYHAEHGTQPNDITDTFPESWLGH